jgi:hypothetical protein
VNEHHPRANSRRLNRPLDLHLRAVLGYLAIAALPAPAFPATWGQSPTAEECAITERISAETIRDVTIALTAADMEGRGTGQPGGVKAAKHLAERFAQLGLQPLGDNGTYLQAIPFQAVRVRPDSSLKAGDQDLKPAGSYVYQRPRHPQRDIVEVRGELVCVDWSRVHSFRRG